MITIQLLFLLLVAYTLQRANALCYFPGHNLADDQPCDPTAEVSTCCGNGDACVSGGMCQHFYDPKNVYVRGSCTDKSWNSPACGGFCVADDPTGAEYMEYCGNGIFCCFQVGCCKMPTTGPNKVYHISLGIPSHTAIAGRFSTSTSTPKASKTASDSVSPSTPQKDSASSSPSSTGSDNGDSSSNTVAIGAGVGVSVGVVAIAGLIGFWLWRRSRSNKQAELPSASIAPDDRNTYAYHEAPMGEIMEAPDQHNKRYLHTTPQELDPTTAVQEMDGSRRAELGG